VIDSTRPTTVPGMQIQALHRLLGSQQNGQLQLCVPPVGVKMFSYRRVKNDERDARDLADLRRMGRLPEAWIAPPATRELRGWVRHRAKLVGLRSSLKCQVHAILAAAGITVAMTDLFGAGGQRLLGGARLAPESRARVDSLLRLIEYLDFEVELFAKLVTNRLRSDAGYQAIQALPGSGRPWPRCSSPRSATSPASPGPRS
jgi:transposase